MGAPSSLSEGMPVTRHTGKHKLISAKATAGADVIIQVTPVPDGLSHLMTLSHGSAPAGWKSVFFLFVLFIASNVVWKGG